MKKLLLVLGFYFTALLALQAQRVLILQDATNFATPTLVSGLQQAGFTVTVSPVREHLWNGTNPSLANFDCVIHLNGANNAWTSRMPAAGQQALVNFVQNNGGGYIHTGWLVYEAATGAGLPVLNDNLILFSLATTSCENTTYSKTVANHPVVDGLPASFSLNTCFEILNLKNFALQPATDVMQNTSVGSGTHPAVAVRNFGNGRIAGINNAGNYSEQSAGGNQSFNNTNILQLMVNATRWASGGINISSLSTNNFCPGTSFTVSYEAAFSNYTQFNADNTLTVQLSNAYGNFSTPVTIGSLPATNFTGTINCTIPADVPYGTGYKLRIMASSPAASGSSSPNPITIGAPQATISANGTTALCEGQSVTLTASAGNSYLWGNGATTPSITVNTAGSYTVTITNAAGCSSTSAATAVTVAPLAAPTISASGTTALCQGQSVTLTASAGNSYLWSNGATTPSITVNTAGSYTVTVTNTAGCSATSAATAITVNPLAAPTITVNSSTTLCQGQSVTLTASAGSSYLWSNGATTPSITVTTAGSYTVTVTNAAGCSSTSAPVNITQNTLPVITPPANITTANTNGSCTAPVSFTATASGVPAPVIGYSVQPGSLFNVGTTVVTVTATNDCGTTTGSFTVTVTDNNKPSIKVPGNFSVQNEPGKCGSLVNIGNATVTDNCGIASITNNAPAFFPAGATTVVWTATDINGNSDTAHQTITVIDNQKPGIAVTNLNAANDIGQCNAIVSIGTPVVTDNCGIATITNNAPAFFPIGTTNVIWTVTDVNGNVATATQTVTVSDNEKPTITTPAVIAVNNDPGICGAMVALTAPATKDNCGVATVTNNAPASFPIGTTSVVWTVADVNGNVATATQSVTVTDSEKPTITAPVAITVKNDSATCGAKVVLATPATKDNCGIATVTNNAPASFPIGTTSVVWTVADVNGNIATATQTVTVTDSEKPTITAPVAITVKNDSATCGAKVVLATPATKDNCGIATVTNNAPPSFPIGTTNVIWTVTDVTGNVTTATQTVTVADNEKPAISVTSINANADPGKNTASITLPAPLTTDNCGVAGTSNNAPALFPIGTTTVTWTLTDVNGNTQTATQTVVVTDQEKPVINCIANQVFCAGSSTSYSIPALVASDNAGIATTYYTIEGATTRSGTGTNASGLFNMGISTVYWTVTDINGNTSTCSFTVSVNPLAAAAITATDANAFCNNVTLTGASGISKAGYTWMLNGNIVATTQVLSLGQSNADGTYQLYVTNQDGCSSTEPATYQFSKQGLSSSYTILAYKKVSLGQNNKVVTGSVGVMTAKGEATFKKNSAVASAGSFVKAPRIKKDGAGINILNPVYGTAAVTLPAMQYNTANAKQLPNKQVAQNSTGTISGNYNNLTIKKGAVVILSGNTFGSIKIENGAQVKFTSAVIDMEELQVEKGTKKGYTYVRFAPNTSIRVSKKVGIGGEVRVNPDNYRITFYMSDVKDDEEKFHVKGGDTKVTANIYMPNGKLKVTGGDDDDDDDDDDNDDDDDECDHHRNQQQNKGKQQNNHHHGNHDHDDCKNGTANTTNHVYMTGLFIAEEVASEGKEVIWNSFDCSLGPISVATTTVTNKQAVVSEKPVAPAAEELKVTVMPNPSTTYFTLKLESLHPAPVQLRIMDATGRMVESKANLNANSSVQVGHHFNSGTYYAELIQGNRRKVVQLVKIR